MKVNNYTFNVQQNVNPTFRSVWTSKRPYNILKGGRNSFKSSVVALLLVYKMVQFISQDKKANIIIVRKVANTLRDSVFLKLQWALALYGISEQFTTTTSPIRITHNNTGAAFYFYGQDDFQKLKSNDVGDIIAVWYEEAAEFKSAEEFDQTNVTFMRQQHKDAERVYFYWSYNPPRNPYSWINEWAQEKKHSPDYLVHESSYEDDELGFVTAQMLAEIERIKENDFDYYRYLYRGEPVGLGTNVYNIDLFQPIKELPKDESVILLYYSFDTGHSVSATAGGCFAYTNKNNLILIDTLYYDPTKERVKKAPNDITKLINDFIIETSRLFPNAAIKNRTVDSADAAIRNQYYKDFGQRLNAVKKQTKEDMIDYVHILLAQKRFYYIDAKVTNSKYTGNNDTFIDEHKRYQYDLKAYDKDIVKVVKEDDHSCDMFQYLCVDNAVDFNLRRW